MATSKAAPKARRKGRKGKHAISEDSYASVTAHYMEQYADAYAAYANYAYAGNRSSGHNGEPDGYRADTSSGEAWGPLSFFRH